MTRDSKGKFVAGNKAALGHSGKGTGRPSSRYLDTVLEAVTLSDWKKIISKAVDQAAHGDKDARKWLSEYLAPVKKELELSGSVDIPKIVNIYHDSNSA